MALKIPEGMTASIKPDSIVPQLLSHIKVVNTDGRCARSSAPPSQAEQTAQELINQYVNESTGRVEKSTKEALAEINDPIARKREARRLRRLARKRRRLATQRKGDE